jgi:hypothetical protein
MTMMPLLYHYDYRRTYQPQFSSLLRHHWLEEAQHAKLDTLMVEAIAWQLSEREVDEYEWMSDVLPTVRAPRTRGCRQRAERPARVAYTRRGTGCPEPRGRASYAV